MTLIDRLKMLATSIELGAEHIDIYDYIADEAEAEEVYKALEHYEKDTVEVVRCQNCKHYTPTSKHSGECGYILAKNGRTGAMHYCNLGQRVSE